MPKKMLEKLSPAEWYLYTRKELALGVGEFGDDAARIDNISTIFPVFFLAVAALVCLTTMARMVEEQRTEIGTLKALGYTDREIQKEISHLFAERDGTGQRAGARRGLQAVPHRHLRCLLHHSTTCRRWKPRSTGAWRPSVW